LNYKKVISILFLQSIYFVNILLPTANAQNIIRDTEIERVIDSYAEPIIKSANLDPKTIKIRIIADNSLNAFVTSGNRMYLNTGTILASDSYEEIVGIIAHEVGHIVGGHTVTFTDQMQTALNTTLLTSLLGVAAGIATGNSDLGMAVALGGQGTAQRQILAFSRGQESAADQFALKALDKTKQSASGLISFFKKISGQELLITDRQDPYVRTHPLTSSRISSIQNHLENSEYKDIKPNEEIEEQHRLIKAKIYSFLKPLKLTIQKYPSSDRSVEAIYARSIAFYRRGNLNKSIPLIDYLIETKPNNPYFWELKGQMLFENGYLEESIESYSKAIKLSPFSPLILIAQAHAMVETGNRKYSKQIQNSLSIALQAEPRNIFAWDLSAKSYSISNQDALSSYAASEKAVLIGDLENTYRYIVKAEKGIERGSPIWLRLQDIKMLANEIKKKRERNKRYQ